MRKILILSIALILVAGIVSVAKPTDIDTSVPWALATLCSRNRHIVQSSNGTIVVLYQRGSGTDPGIRAKKSTNFGSSWTNLAGGGGSTQIDSSTAVTYSICIDDNDNIYVVYTEGTDIIRFMKLIYSAGSWSKGTERTVVSASDTANPFIIRESGGRIWVAYGYDDGTPAGVKAIRSDNEFQSAGVTYTVYTENYMNDEDFYPALTIRGVDPFLVFGVGYGELWWSSWNGSSWSGSEEVQSFFQWSGDLSVTMIGNDVHVVGIYGDYTKHTYYNGSSWSPPETIRTVDSDEDIGPSLTTDDVNLWCFAAIYYEDSSSEYDQYDIKYKKRTGSTWGGSWIAITGTLMDRHPGTPSISRQKIPLAWTRGSASPYTAKFDYSIIIDITPPEAPTSVNADPSDWTSNDSFDVDWTNPVPPDPSGIAGAYYKLDSVPTSDTDGTWTTAKPINNITVGTDGSHPIYIWLKDKSYNVNYQNRDTTLLKLDTTPPGAPTSVDDGVSGWSTDDMPTFTWNSPGDTSGIDGYWWAVNNPTPEIGGTWTTLTTATTSSLDDGEHTFYVKAQNGSGLIGPAGSHVCQIDDTPPGTPQNVDDGVEGSSNDNMPTFTWDSVTDTSGVPGYWWAVDDDTPEGETWTTETTATTAPLSDGDHTFYVKAQNGAGLYSVSPGSHTCVIDTTAPAAITDLSGQHETGDVILSWSTPGDDGWNNTLPSGSKYIIDYSSYSIQWSTSTYEVDISTSGVAPHTEVSHTITGLQQDTTWYFQIWTRDEVPNWSGLSNGATVWILTPSQTYTWTGNGAEGDWDDTNNWDVGGSYPDDKDHKAVIDLTSSEDINTGAARTLGELELGGNYTGTLTLGGALP